MTGQQLKYATLKCASRPEFWFCALAVWTLLSALRSFATPWAGAALTEWVRWAAGIGTALALGRFLTRTRLFSRLVTLLAGLMALAALAHGATSPWGMTGPFNDHQLFGSTILLALPMTLSVGLTARSPRWRTLAQAVFFLLLMELILSQARSAWAGAGLGLLVFIVLWMRVSAGQGTRRLQSFALLAAGLLTAFAVLLCVTEMQKPIALRLASFTSLKRDIGWQTRGQIWHGAMDMIISAPGIGYGIGQYPDTQHKFTHTGRILTPSQRPSLSEEAHSLYLQTAAEIGWPGLVLYLLGLLMLAGRCIYSLRRAWGTTPGSREATTIATLALLLSQSVDALASPSWQFGEISLPFWCLLGLGMAAIARADVPEPLSVTLRRPARLVLAVSAVTFAALAVFLLMPLSPVEAYSALNHLRLTSVTVTPSRTTVQCHGVTQTVTLTAVAHYQWTLSNTPAPDKDLTFDGPPDGVSGTVFTIAPQSDCRAWFLSLDPGRRNVMTIPPLPSTSIPQSLTITAKCDALDGDTRRVVTSVPVHIQCLP